MPIAPIVQGNQIRFVANHPQLALLGTVAAWASDAITVELPAKIVWNEDHTQRLYAAFAGRINAIRVDIGQTVKAGQALAILDSADFGQARADAASAAAGLQLTQKTLRRQKELFDDGIVAQKDLEAAQADAARAAAEHERATARVRMYGTFYDGHGTAINQLALASGINGVVVERNLNPGQQLRPDQSGAGVPPLFVISDPSSLWVQVDAKEGDAAGVKVEQSFDLVVPALNNRVVKAQIKAIADFIDPATRTIKIRGVVDNRDHALKAEMLATARLVRPNPQGSVIVPASATLLTGARHLVFVQVAPGVFEPREVMLGFEGTKEEVITKGLKPGERVVHENTLLLARLWRTMREASQKP